MSDAYLAESARSPGFGGGDGDLSERSEYAIAFCVLLFFGLLGWWLMQPESIAEPALANVQNETPDYGFTSTETAVEAPRTERVRIRQPAVQQQALGTETSVPVAEETVVAQPALDVVPPPAQTVQETVQQPVTPEIFREVPIELPVQKESVEAPPIVEEPIIEEVIEVEVETAPETEAQLFQRAMTNVRFVTASAVLTEPSRVILDDIYALVQSRPDSKLRIVGHTDSQGEADKNARLSYARAEACMDYLLAAGLTIDRVNAAGFGELQPIASNLTEEGRRENRRVEFELVPLDS